MAFKPKRPQFDTAPEPKFVVSSDAPPPVAKDYDEATLAAPEPAASTFEVSWRDRTGKEIRKTIQANSASEALRLARE